MRRIAITSLLKRAIDYTRAHAVLAWLAVFLAAMALAPVTGCAEGRDGAGRLKVAADIVPLADFCSQIGGGLVEVETLVPPGATPHTYELSTAQTRFLEEADVLVVAGLELTPWAAEVFAKAGNPGVVVVAGEAVPRVELVEVAGSGAGVYDPHIWLDPNLAVFVVEAIRDGLSEADPVNATVFRDNAERYIEQLMELDDRITAEVSLFSTRKFVAFHSTWTYFARRYGLEQVGVIEELPGKEPSAGEIADLVELVEGQGVRVVFAEPQFSTRVAETIAEESDGEVTVKLLDPLGDPSDAGTDTYIEMMARNVEIMGEAMK